MENFEEENKVEVELDIINKHNAKPEVKTFSDKKPLLLTRGLRKKTQMNSSKKRIKKLVHQRNSSNLISSKEKKMEHLNHRCIIFLF